MNSFEHNRIPYFTGQFSDYHATRHPIILVMKWLSPSIERIKAVKFHGSSFTFKYSRRQPYAATAAADPAAATTAT